MTREELRKALEERQEMQRIIDEAQKVVDARTAEIKDHMTAAGIDEFAEGPYKVTWKYSKPRTVPDADALRAAGLFDQYSKQQAPARPFRVN